jgi:hypothetical protein
MTPEQITIITVYLGIGGVSTFFGDWKSEINKMQEYAHNYSPDLPNVLINFCVAFVVCWMIVTWPFWLVMDVIDYLKKRSK